MYNSICCSLWAALNSDLVVSPSRHCTSLLLPPSLLHNFFPILLLHILTHLAFSCSIREPFWLLWNFISSAFYWTKRSLEQWGCSFLSSLFRSNNRHMCSLALASSGSLLLLVLIALSTTRQEALSAFRKMPYVAIARWKSLKFWKNPPEHLFYLLLTLLHSIRQSSAKAEVIPFNDTERMLLFTGTCVGKISKLSSHISKDTCNWEEKLPVLWYQIQWTAHTCNKHCISNTLQKAT